MKKEITEKNTEEVLNLPEFRVARCGHCKRRNVQRLEYDVATGKCQYWCSVCEHLAEVVWDGKSRLPCQVCKKETVFVSERYSKPGSSKLLFFDKCEECGTIIPAAKTTGIDIGDIPEKDEKKNRKENNDGA